MTTMISNEAVHLNMDTTVEQENGTVQEPFDYRQFSKAMNRSRYLDELKLRDK